jgi:imidazole glycerol-phosphate synthase subunit HisH
MALTIIDYGMGNVGSIQNMLKKVGCTSIISSNAEIISKAEKLILPGVGAFDKAMQNLNDLGLIDVIDNRVKNDKIPILGICLGMQLLAKSSEEGLKKGLGWIDAEVKKFNFESTTENDLKIPHMGWNSLFIKSDSLLFKDLPKEHRFYFVHSYHVVCQSNGIEASSTHYGYDFISSVCSENIMGVQFHPEKSHKFGYLILKNFVENF